MSLLAKKIFFLGAAVVLSAALSLAQISTTSLSGTVYDASGAVVVGAGVTVTNDATGVALKQTTNTAGLYAFPSIGVGTYTVTVEMTGFKTVRRAGTTLVVGTPAIENINLELGDTREVVRVEASAAPINTATATLGNVVEHQAVASLPLNGRNPLNLIVLEPGVQQNSGTTLTVNGTRSMAGNVTIDGIEANEASNPVPTNNVFRINPDNVEEFKVTTSNPTPEEGKNSGLNVSIATRSGTNEYHVSAIEYFRNTVLNANEFYANAQGNPRTNIHSNQYGFDAGGPIKKNKTFVYGAWQGQQVNLALAIDKAFGKIPNVYTPEALAGNFRYFVANPASPLVINGQKITANSPALVTANGALAPGVRNCGSPTDLNCIQTYNIFQNDPLHIGGDPGVLKLLGSYPSPNNFTTGDGLNIGGYLWNTPYEVRGPRNLVRVDHVLNSSNSIYFRVLWAEEDQLKGDPLNSRPAVFPGFPPRGEVYRPAQNYALSWRSVLNPAMVNELTLGFARFSFLFTYIDSNPNAASLPAYTFNTPIDVSYVNQPHSVRWLNTPQFIDNFSWIRGAHQLKFGVNARLYQQNNQGGTAASQGLVPSISLSSTLNPPGAAFGLPTIAGGSTAGINSTDNAQLLSSINNLLGIPANIKAAFLGNLNSDTFIGTRSGNYYSLWDTGERLKQYNFYAQDEWRVRKNLTITYGVRWEINLPPTESSEPVFVPNKPINGSEGPVTFVRADSWWQRSNLDAFAPRIGISWSPFGDKTVIHAGYGIAFDPITTYMAAAAANSLPGLAFTCTSPTYAAPTPGCASVPNVRLSQGFPSALPPPSGVKPSSFLSPPAQLLGNAPNTVVLDPNLKQATVHQWNISIQRQLPGDLVLQAAYVANRGERLYSQLDVNQISAAPILPDFLAMQANVNKKCNPDGSGCPSGVNGQSISLVTSGILTGTFVNSSATRTDLGQNAAGNFAGRIEQTTLAAHLRPNQQFGSIMFLSNSADSVYHSLQTTLRKRFSGGLLFNFAYTYSKVIDDQSADPIVTTFTPTSVAAIDNNNLRLDRARADFDQRHVIISTWIYELPFGKGKKWMSGAPRIVDAVLGGWSLQGFNSNMSGQPFSISSGAKTAFYSASSSPPNCCSRAVVVGNTLPGDALQPKAGTVGPAFFQDASAFALPAPGQTGMGRNLFNGPWYWDMDGAISKTFSATERVKITFRMEAFNALNHTNFRKLSSASVGSTNILSPNFGIACCQSLATSTSTAIVSNGEAYRVAQAVLKVAFYNKVMKKLVLSICAAALMVICLSSAKNSSTRTVTVSEGTNVNVTVSPDHKTIIMDLQETLWSLPITGGAAKRLTDPFLEPARPDWSPKGDLVAFQSFKGGTFHIWLMKPDGTGVRQLTEGHADDREPRFSPDGNRVAFSSDRAFKGNYDIWVADVDTGKLTQWTSSPADEFEPSWSPDGAEIAFVSGTGAAGTSIQSADAGGHNKSIVSAIDGARINSPSWSPDGKKIAYTQISGNQTRLMISGKLIGTDDDVFPFPAAWLSADQILYTGNGKILLTTLDAAATKSIPFQAKFQLNRSTYKHRQLDFDSAAARPAKGILTPALSPDGNRIVFEALNQLWLMEIGSKPQQLTHDGYYKQSPAWSPDGKQIAYSSDKAGTADIYVLDVVTKSERRVTSLADSAELVPVWSPDGKKLAFQKQDGTTYSVDLASGEIKEAVKATYEPGKPSWSANGKAISLAALRPYTRRFREGMNLIETVDVASGKVAFTEPAPYKSISTRSVDGPIYSPDGSQMAFVMDGYLWVRPVDANGIPIREARPINEEMTDAPTWSGDGKRMLYLSNGTLRIIASDGSTPPTTVPIDLAWHRESSANKTVVHAGRLWDGLGPNESANMDVTVVGRRIQKIEPHRDDLHQGADVVDASNLTVMPGLWEAHNHGYGGLSSYGDRAGRIWLAYGFTDLQSQGDTAYGQMEIKESFGSGSRVGPRYFSAGEPIDGERGYYATDHGVTSEKELQLELNRAQALQYDNLKTYVRLPHELQLVAMKFAHEKLGVYADSHYGLPGLTYGMDGMTHVSATSRWGYSYTRSYGGATYQDIRSLFAAAGEFIISTPFAASALYAEDPQILDDPRIATLNTPWSQRTMTSARDRAMKTDQSQTLDNLKKEEETLISVMRGGGTILLGTDSPLPGLAIVNHLGLRAEVKFGMQPWEALQTATLLPAKAYGYGKDLGSLQAGKLADLVMVSGDPLRDIKDAANVQRVMVDGRLYSTKELMAPFEAK